MWISQVRLLHKDVAIPFHLPSKTFVEAKLRSVSKEMFNAHQWLETFKKYPSQNFCKCAEVLKQHPHLKTVDGHIASPAVLLRCPKAVSRMLSFSGSCTFFPSKVFFLSTSSKMVERWADHHSLPRGLVVESWRCFVEEQWPKHLDDVHTNQRFTHKLLCYARRLAPQLVWHSRDHAYQQMLVYCPELYKAAVLNTFEDADVYQEVPGHPTEIGKALLQPIPKRIAHRYKWAINWRSNLPQAFVFLKEKRNFKKARSIISYKRSALAKLLCLASLVLSEIAQVCFPSSFGQMSLHQIWPSLHAYLASLETAPQCDMVTVNDDLVGFFNSLPTDRLLRVVEFCQNEFFAKQPSSGRSRDGFCFSVRFAQKSSNGRVFRGKPRKFRSEHVKVMHAEDITPVVELSFRFAIFSVLNRCFKQQRGSPIGNQLSPILCGLAVSFEEEMWCRTHEVLIQSYRVSCWFLRYVDNRCLVFPSQLLKMEPFRWLLRPDFCTAPVLLETCEPGELLGCSVSVEDKTVSYVIPCELWQYRCPESGGSIRVNLSGFGARLFIIARQVYPVQNRSRQIRQLIVKYREIGFSYEDLVKCMPRKFRKLRQ